MAARPPVNTPAAAAAPAAPEPVTAESLGWQLRAALPPLRLHSVSLYDAQANVLWLSEGALGPDEHTLVLDAVEVLANDRSKLCYENGLEDGRVAIFLPVRAPQGDLVGIAMILADLKSVGDGVLERIVSPQLRTIMQKVAVLLRASSALRAKPTTNAKPGNVPVAAAPEQPIAATSATAAAAAADAEPSLSPQAINDILEFELSPAVTVPAITPAPVTTPTPAIGAQPTASVDWETFGTALELLPEGLPQAVVKPIATPASVGAPAPTAVSAPTKPAAPLAPVTSTVTTGATTTSKVIRASATTGTARALNGSTGHTGTVPAVNSPSTTQTSRTLALDPSSLILDVQPFAKLRSGGRTRRYEVLPRIPHRESNRAPAAMDGVALQRLLSWLASNRSAWSLEPTSFSLNLSIATLEDERFPQQVASCLKANGIAPDNLGFEIAEPLCTQRRAQVERFISLCDKLGCFVVIDDFSLDSSVLPLLRSKALRLVKIDPRLTTAALRDKLSQAMVVAIVQAVKVLGIHCAAKRVESQASLQWLTAIGCDLAQGPALSQVVPIESLNMPANMAAEAGKTV